MTDTKINVSAKALRSKSVEVESTATKQFYDERVHNCLIPQAGRFFRCNMYDTIMHCTTACQEQTFKFILKTFTFSSYIKASCKFFFLYFNAFLLERYNQKLNLRPNKKKNELQN